MIKEKRNDSSIKLDDKSLEKIAAGSIHAPEGGIDKFFFSVKDTVKEMGEGISEWFNKSK